MDIYIDFDGVIIEFVEGMARRLGKEDWIKRWPLGEYSMYSGLGVPDDDIWEAYRDQAFWEGLETYAWKWNLVKLCNKYAPVSYATYAITPAAAAGKAVWAQKNCIYPLIQLLDVENKNALARPGAVLIDDSDKNVAAFREIPGARAILFPQPWNAMHHRDTASLKLAWVAEALESYAGQLNPESER